LEKLADVFDEILLYMIAYPVTMFNLLFFPQMLFGEQLPSTHCPASVCFVIGVVLWTLGVRLELSLEVSDVDMELIPAKDTLMKLVVPVVFLLIVQWVSAALIFRLPLALNDPVASIQALSYPISLALATHAPVIILAILFPRLTKLTGGLEAKLMGKLYPRNADILNRRAESFYATPVL